MVKEATLRNAQLIATINSVLEYLHQRQLYPSLADEILQLVAAEGDRAPGHEDVVASALSSGGVWLQYPWCRAQFTKSSGACSCAIPMPTDSSGASRPWIP